MSVTFPYNLPSTRNEALALGMKHYFNGTPCKYGHVAARYVSTQSCVTCCNNRSRKQQGLPEVWPDNVSFKVTLRSAGLIPEVERFVEALNERFDNDEQLREAQAQLNVSEFLAWQRKRFEDLQAANAKTSLPRRGWDK